MRLPATATLTVLTLLTLLVLLGLAGCGSSEGLDDGGADAGDSSAPDATSPAILPWLPEGRPPVVAPQMTPCPDGWAELSEGSAARCTPYPDGPPAACARPDEAHFPGQSGCELIGTECAVDGWPMEIPTGPAVFLSSTAPLGGTGTRESPYRTLSQVDLTSLTPGSTLVFGTGRYVAGIVIPTGVRLLGTCVGGTTLTYTSGTARAVLRVYAPDTSVANLRIDGGSRRGVTVAGDDASVSFESVVIEGAQLTGVSVTEGATVTMTDVAIRDTAVAADTGRYGRALVVESGARVEMRRGEVVGASETAVFSLGQEGVMEKPEILLEDVRVGDVHLDSRGVARAVAVEAGGRLTVRKSHLSRNAHTGVFTSHPDSEMTLEDVVVEETGEVGVYAREGTLTMTRTTISKSVRCGLELQVAGTVASARDLIVLDTTAPEEEGLPHLGGACLHGGRLDVERSLFARNAGHGLWTQNDIAQSRFVDVEVRATNPVTWSTVMNGRGVMVQLGASLELERAIIEENQDVGVLVAVGGASVQFTDVAIIDTQPLTDGRFGHGLGVIYDAEITGTRVLVDRAHGLGADARRAGAHLTLTDVVVRDVMPATCSECPGHGITIGVGSYVQADVVLNRFSILDSGTCGVQLSNNGRMDLHDGVVRGHQIGACVQQEYELGRLTDMVAFDNDANLEATTLPVPEPIESIEPEAP